MIIGAPEAIVLVLAIALAAWRFPGLGLFRPLRALTLVFALLYFVDLRIETKSGDLDLWLLVDRSASNAAAVAESGAEWERILEAGRPSGDTLRILDYAVEPELRIDNERYSGGTEETRTAFAIRTALGLSDPARSNRILLLSDGYSTEPIGDLAEALVLAETPLDHRLSIRPDVFDARIERFTVAERAQPGEALLLEARLVVTKPATVAVELFRDGRSIHRGQVSVGRAGSDLRLSDRLRAPGAHRYELAISAPGDKYPGNDREARYVELVGGPRVLLVSRYRPAPIEAVLVANGVSVDVAGDPARLEEASLTGVRAVILDDVPAHRLAPRFLAALPFFVEGQGGGLVMTGGKHSFGAGGYFESAIDPILPVSLELKKDHRKLAVAMAVVLDRSCSMGAPVEGGHTKMDLADNGVARMIQLLQDNDQLAIHAVDSSDHVVAPMAAIGESRSQLISAVRRVESGGGGIYVGVGLEAGWKSLKQTKVGQRHLILYSDAADSEEPADYKRTIAELTKSGATLSVIGMGRPTDSDGPLLEEIARLGNGRIFFTERAAELPAIFAQETVAVARSAFVEEPTPVVGHAAWLGLAARGIEWPSTIEGYNLSYLKEGAALAASAKDQHEGPLVAYWQRGLGHVAAISFPLGGESAASVLAWPGYADFGLSVTRWAMGNEVPAGASLYAGVDGTRLLVELFLDRAFEATLVGHTPQLRIATDHARAPESPPWNRIGPGRYRASVTLPAGAVARGAVELGRDVVPFGPLNSSAGAEWAFDPSGPRALAALSPATGGRAIVDLGDVWRSPRSPEHTSFGGLWLALWLVTFLLEIGATRFGLGQAPLWMAPVPPEPKLSPSPATPPPGPDAEVDRARKRRLLAAKDRSSKS